jgi:hypothetical protein
MITKIYNLQLLFMKEDINNINHTIVIIFLQFFHSKIIKIL